MNNRIALVTGASRGIGRSVATHLGQNGYHVILISRNKDKLESLASEINKSNGSAVFFVVDVSVHLEVKKVIKQIINQYERIDLLFNNAAILKRGTIELPDEEIQELIDINLNGAIFVAKHVATQMKKQRNGYIINVSSLGGKFAMSFSGIYAASKFGLSGFSESLAKEMSVYGVKVTNICPSMVATEMANGRKFLVDQMIQMEDINSTIDYLLSLSKNAVPTEVLLSCLPLIAKMTELTEDMYLK